MKRSKAVALTLAAATGMIAAVVGLRCIYGPLAAEHWRRQLDTVADDRAAILLEQVAALGEPGIPVLVEALGSPRESVARAGKQVLLERIERWQMLPGRQSSPRLAALAEALAAGVEQFGPTARADASELAGRILLWPLDAAVVDRARVIGCCEEVLRATAGKGPAGEEAVVVGRPPSPPQIGRMGETPRRQTDQLEPSGMAIAKAARLPGGGLPIDALPGEDAPQGPLEPARMAEVPGERPRRLQPPPSTDLPPGPREPNRISVLPDEAQSLPSSPGRLGRAREPSRVRPLLAVEREAFGEAATAGLMRSLHACDPHTAAAAEAELRRRGFTTRGIQLARRVSDPDPQTRKETARALPGLPGVDALPWLRWLGRDANAEVRLTAITLMATSSDPAVMREVEALARSDPDPRIRRQAERIAERTRNHPR